MRRTHIKLLACITLVLSLLTSAAESALTDDFGDPLPPGAVARLGSVRFRHTYARFAVFSPDGKTIASWGSSDGQLHDIIVWETVTGRPLRRLTPVCMPADPDYSHYTPLAFSPDGRLLAAGGTTDFNTPNHKDWVELWEVASGKKLRQIPFARPDQVYSLAFSPDGKTLAVADHGKHVQLIDVATGQDQQRLTLVPGWTTRGLRHAPDGTLLAYGTRIFTELKREKWEAAQLELREAATGKVVAQVANPDPRDIYCHFTFSSDGKTVVVWNDRKLLSVWDTTTGKSVRQWPAASVDHLVLSSDAATLAILNDSAIQLWNPATGTRVERGDDGPGPVQEMALSADGRRLATRSRDQLKRILVWDTATRRPVGRYEDAMPIHNLALSADGGLLAADRGGIVVWDIANQRELRKLQSGRGALALAPDGKTLAVAKALTVWDIASGNKVLAKPELYLRSVAWSPNGRWIAGSGHALKEFNNHFVALWDSAGRELHRFPLGEQRVRALAFSADGKVLAAGLDGWREAVTLRAWDATSGKELAPFQQRRTSLVTTANQQGMFRYNQPQSIHCLALSPDGKTLAAVENHHETTVYLWETATGKERGELRGHEAGVTGVAFFPDGRHLASGSLDRTVLIWDLHFESQARVPAGEVETLWSDLADEDTARAYRAMQALVRDPATAVPLLRRLRPRPTPDAARLAQLIKDLDSPQFATRQEAFAELEKLGGVAGAALKKALEGNPGLEVRRRIDELLSRFERGRLSGADVQGWRALEVLEHIGTPEAKEVLAKLADGPAGHLITEEARAALNRLAAK